jgi:DHA1 family bicyclomycin/chloramphenicol resistance-like MFS transporter
MGLGALASACIGFFEQTSAVPMVLIMTVTSVIALTVLFFGRKNIVAAPAGN